MNVELKPLSEQVIVITGGSSGNGLATAREAVNRGARVVIAARNEEALRRVAGELGADRVAVCPADVSREEDVERIARVATERFGGFDSWVNNAAAATYGRVEAITLEDHRRVFDVNYFGVLMGSLVAARHLKSHGGGAIINLGSVLSDRAMILQGPYSASKAAVQAATDALRMELEEQGAPISVTLIKPGSIDTPYPEHAKNLMEEPPRLPPMLYDPALVADAVLFACEHPRRHLYVGGSGYLVSLAGRLAPRLTDAAMELFGVGIQQKPGDPGDETRRDNLHEARTDGEAHGDQKLHVRQTSLLLEAQKNPLNVPGAAAKALFDFGRSITGRRHDWEPIMDDERIRAFERDLWIGGEDVYRARVSTEVQMVLPQEPYVRSGEDAIGAVAGTPRWETVELDNLRVSRPEEGLIVIAYEARASRGDEHYRAYCTSTFRRRGHEDWEVIQHQQTVGLTN